MNTFSAPRFSSPWAIVIGATLISGAIVYTAEVIPFLQLLGTLSLVVLAYVSVCTARRIEWFTGAMERHSDQQRQIAAKNANIKLIWWDKTKPETGGRFPESGAHGDEVQLETIYVGLPLHQREKRPCPFRKPHPAGFALNYRITA